MKVLISPSSFGQVSEIPLDIMREHGIEYTLNLTGRKLTEEEVIELGKDCIGIIAGVEPLTAKVMDAIPSLKCISRVGVGMDNVDIKYAIAKGIQVVNTPDGPTRSVAELTLAMTLAVLRKIPQATASMKQREWKKYTGSLLQNKVIGIIGLGRIGKKVAEFFRALGNRVVGFDIDVDTKWCEKNGVEPLGFTNVLSAADILTIHVPGTNGAEPMIGKKELKIIKKGAILINISRGGVVDEQALYESLSDNYLEGAAIDVFLEEPYTGPLCDLDNVILTPHIGSYAEEGKVQMEISAVHNLIQNLR